MQPFYPAENSLNVNVCYSTNELIKLKNDLFAHEMVFGSYMLIIGVCLGIAIMVAYPHVYKWATEVIE